MSEKAFSLVDPEDTLQARCIQAMPKDFKFATTGEKDSFEFKYSGPLPHGDALSIFWNAAVYKAEAKSAGYNPGTGHFTLSYDDPRSHG